MKLFVGLGNPGAKYAHNRHNIGFMALDRIAEDHQFTPWRSKFQGQICDGTLAGQKVLLLKPTTFMNLSGQSVGAAVRFHKIPLDQVTVFHDELDLAPGKLRLKQGGGHAGHNGLRSLHAHLGADYRRVRLGIGHPGHKDAVAGFVLRDFAAVDQNWLAAMLTGIGNGAKHLAAGERGKVHERCCLANRPTALFKNHQSCGAKISRARGGSGRSAPLLPLLCKSFSTNSNEAPFRTPG